MNKRQLVIFGLIIAMLSGASNLAVNWGRMALAPSKLEVVTEKVEFVTKDISVLRERVGILEAQMVDIKKSLARLEDGQIDMLKMLTIALRNGRNK